MAVTALPIFRANVGLYGWRDGDHGEHRKRWHGHGGAAVYRWRKRQSP